MSEIQIGEYVRTKHGSIDKVINNEYYVPQYVECEHVLISKDNIVNHSKNIIDLVTIEDIFKVKEGDTIAYIGFTNDYLEEYVDFINTVKTKEIELLEVLTKEQFKQNSYKVGD